MRCSPSQKISPRSAGRTPRDRQNESGLAGTVGAEQRRDFAGRTLIETSRSTGRPPRATNRLRTVSSDAVIGLLASEVGAAHDRIVKHGAGRPHGEALAEVQHHGLHADGGDQIGVVVDEHEL